MNFELRASHDFKVSGSRIVGRPVVYDSLSEDLGGFKEIISKGAFSASLNNDVRALVEHQPTLLLGRTSSNTVSLREDDYGLLVEIEPPDIQSARDLMVSIQRGDISGMSFGFSVAEGDDEWDYRSTPPTRTVKQATLHEITITSMPAYKATNVSVAMRSMLTQQRNNVAQELVLKELI